MPYRPTQHQIASQAVAAVTAVWANSGAAVEEVKQDYGEDLLVQPCLENVMDSARIWVQVKGVQGIPESAKKVGKANVRIRADLALRWARSADILVLVLWDISQNVGWYTIPGLDALWHGELARRGRGEIPVEIDLKNAFNSKSVELVTWEARIAHLADFTRSLRWLEQENRQLAGEDHQTASEDRAWCDDAIRVAVTDLMVNLQMIWGGFGDDERIGFQSEFARLVVRNLDANELARPDGFEDAWGQAIMASILQQTEMVTGTGLPTIIVAEMTMIAFAVFKGIWDDAHGISEDAPDD